MIQANIVYRANDNVPEPTWLPAAGAPVLPLPVRSPNTLWYCPTCANYPTTVQYVTSRKFSLQYHLNACANAQRLKYATDVGRYDQQCDISFQE